MMLYCHIQNYHWGKKGRASEVGLLAEANRPSYKIEDEKPYAELWMGTHISGPSIVIESGLLLVDYLQKNPAVLGYEVRERFQKLPFLFKILSIALPLSVQAHPTKEHAERLHAAMPELYPDPNHKPEMAIALSEFEVLCGFRPIDEIRRFMQAVPDLRSLVGEENFANLLASDEANLQTVLKACFRSLMSATDNLIADKVRSHVASLRTLDEPSRQSLLGELIERLNQHYPDDVGVFAPYFFNYFTLQPGEAVYLGPNEPHAYLSGDCVECMACSDNVVRAGLTPKAKDVETLCEMLTYICEPPSGKFITPISEDQYSVLYKPPIADFAVARIVIPETVKEYYLITRKSASICIVIKGKGEINKQTFNRGSIFFLHAGQKNFITIREPEVVIFQAMANI